MKKMLMLLLTGMVLFGCKKDSDPEVETSAAQSGKVVCEIDGKAYSHYGSGYVLGDNFSFVKAENGTEQLSIDFYGMRDGEYIITGDDAKTVGNAKIYFFADQSTKVTYVSKSGTFKVTKYQLTGGFKVSGTFSATLEKFNDKKPTGETIEIKNGSFTDIVLMNAR